MFKPKWSELCGKFPELEAHQSNKRWLTEDSIEELGWKRKDSLTFFLRN